MLRCHHDWHHSWYHMYRLPLVTSLACISSQRASCHSPIMSCHGIVLFSPIIIGLILLPQVLGHVVFEGSMPAFRAFEVAHDGCMHGWMDACMHTNACEWRVMNDVIGGCHYPILVILKCVLLGWWSPIITWSYLSSIANMAWHRTTHIYMGSSCIVEGKSNAIITNTNTTTVVITKDTII